MKPEELAVIWRVVKAGEDRALEAPDLRLLMRLRSALMLYEDERRPGPASRERRCHLCHAPVSRCCC